MKEARYLVRIAPNSTHQPKDSLSLLARSRQLAVPYKGKTINLRVSATALEFDLFCAPEAEMSSFFDAFKPLGTVITFKRLDVPPSSVIPTSLVSEARQLFNEYRFWEVHEVLEGLWKEREGSEKQLVQGLILMAAALVHGQKDERSVMWKMMQDALTRLDHQPDDYYGWNIRKFKDHFAHVLELKELTLPTV